MATIENKYIDAVNLALATSVFNDAALTVTAASGWYTDGTTTRFLDASGNFTDSASCPDCFSPCDESDSGPVRLQDVLGGTPSPVTFPAQSGTYTIPFTTGTGPNSEGAVIVSVFLRLASSSTSTDYSAPLGLYAWLEEGDNNIVYTTNNFSSSGTTVVTPTEVAQGGVIENGPAGTVGSVKNINNTLLDVNNLPVWVGKEASTQYSSADTSASTCSAGTLDLPNNAPFAVGSAAATVTKVGLPNYRYDWVNNSFVTATTPTADIVVQQKQVQVGPSNVSGQGYRGWYTTVIPKTNIFQNRVNIQIQNILCEASATVIVGCPRKLIGFYVSDPATSIPIACSSQISSLKLYNVPGKSTWSQGTYNVEFQGGRPNLGDIICSGANGEDLSSELKEKYYKYIDNEGVDKLFYIDQYGIVSETNTDCNIAGGEFDTSYVQNSNTVGGGIYRSGFEIPIGSTGSVIVRVLTGNNPKGLIVSHKDASNNLLGKTNLFSIRGAGVDNFLDQTGYEQHMQIGANTIYFEAGGHYGGSSLVMGGKNADAGTSYSPLYPFEGGIEENPNNIWAEKLVYDYYFCCQDVNQNSCTNSDSNVNWGVPEYLNCYGDTQNFDGVLCLDSNPVFIGKALFSESSIPGTSEGADYFTGNPIACSAGFDPDGGGNPSSANVAGIINLPPNGNHPGTDISQIAPSVNPEFEAAESEFYDALSCNYNVSVPNTVGDIYTAFRYPEDTTGCSGGVKYTTRMLSDIAGGWIDLNTYNRRFYIMEPQVQLYKPSDNAPDATPGWSMAVIPLTGTTTALEYIELDVYVPTSNVEFQIYVDAPAALPASTTTIYGPYSLAENQTNAAGTIGALCTAGTGSGPTQTVYIARNAWGGASGPCVPGVAGAAGTPCQNAASVSVVPRINDMLFSDANGATRIPAGRYYYNENPGTVADNRIIEVDEWGVVTCLSGCYGTFAALYTGLCPYAS